MAAAAAVASVAVVAVAAAMVMAATAAAAVAAGVAAAEVAAAEVAVTAEVAMRATAAVTIAFTPSDLTLFRLRYLNFFRSYFLLQLRNYIQKFESFVSYKRHFFTSDIWNLEIISVRTLTFISITPLTRQPQFSPTIPKHHPPQPIPIVQTCVSVLMFFYLLVLLTKR